MPFSFQGEMVYSRAYNKKRKASKDFVKLYKVASNIIDQNNEIMMEVVFGNFGGFFSNETGLLIATKTRLLFVGDKYQDFKQKSWDYQDIDRPSLKGHALSDTLSFEYNKELYEFKNVSEGNAHSMLSYLKKQVESRNLKNPKAVVETETENVVEEIKRYKVLFDEGIITEEEFSAKKKKLLGI